MMTTAVGKHVKEPSERSKKRQTPARNRLQVIASIKTNRECSESLKAEIITHRKKIPGPLPQPMLGCTSNQWNTEHWPGHDTDQWCVCVCVCVCRRAESPQASRQDIWWFSDPGDKNNTMRTFQHKIVIIVLCPGRGLITDRNICQFNGTLVSLLWLPLSAGPTRSIKRVRTWHRVGLVARAHARSGQRCSSVCGSISVEHCHRKTLTHRTEPVVSFVRHCNNGLSPTLLLQLTIFIVNGIFVAKVCYPFVDWPGRGVIRKTMRKSCNRINLIKELKVERLSYIT